MKRFTLLALFIFSVRICFGQNQKYDEAIKQLLINFNASNIENIFNSFSNEMKAALPLTQSKAFFNGLMGQAGQIKEVKLMKMENVTVAVYKTVFEKTILDIHLSLDKLSNINGLYIKPHEEEKTPSKLNNITGLPLEIAIEVQSKLTNFPLHSQVSIAIIHGGKVANYGVLVEKDSLKLIDNKESVFEIGSITKVFTSTILAALVIEQKVKLDQSINKYYPFAFNQSSKTSFINLANHTSSLPRLPDNIDLQQVTNPYKNYNEKLLNEYLSKLIKIDSQTPKQYNYSNLGAGLLGHTISLVEKKPFTEILSNRIFKKYQMNNTYTKADGIRNKLIRGRDAQGNEVPNWDFDVLFGGGGILSTTADLTNFVQAHFDSTNLELALTGKPTFDVNDQMKIGLGWHILQYENEFKWHWHNGGTGGYSSSMVIDKTSKNAVIILSNVSAFHPKMGEIDKLCFALMDQLSKSK